MIDRSLRVRVTVVGASLFVLATIYVFQGVDFLSFLTGLFSAYTWHPFVVFIVNKTLRLVINDLACFGIIWAIFQSQRHLTVAFYIFLFELFVLLPLYFGIKLSLEGDSEISSPLLAQVHRMIVNPTLMILLIAGFFYQRFKK